MWSSAPELVTSIPELVTILRDVISVPVPVINVGDSSLRAPSLLSDESLTVESSGLYGDIPSGTFCISIG